MQVLALKSSMVLLVSFNVPLMKFICIFTSVIFDERLEVSLFTASISELALYMY